MRTNKLFFLPVLAIGVFLTLVTGCSKDEEDSAPPAVAAPTANFSFSNGECTVPCAVTFSNSSANAVSYSWDFGDGGSSTETNPSHTYTSPGSRSVSLTATNSAGAANVITKTVTTVAPVNQTNTQKLTANGLWKITAVTSSLPWNWPLGSQTNGQTDWFSAFMDDCEKAKRASFDADNSITFSGINQNNINGQPCNTEYPSGILPFWYELFGTEDLPGWYFTTGETKLEIDGQEWNILALTGSELRLSVTENVDGTNFTITVTFTH